MKRSMMKRFKQSVLALLFGISLGCAHAPIKVIQRPKVTLYFLDPSSQKLRAEVEAGDLPVTVCEKEPCLVLSDADMRAIEKYVIILEDKSSRCQK